MNIALIPNRGKSDAIEAAGRLREIIAQRLAGSPGGSVSIIPDLRRDQLDAFQPDLIVVLGGDGSMLSAAQVIAGMCTPVVGINFGKLGYLAAFTPDEFLENLDSILSDQAPKTQRLMLEAAVFPWPRRGVAAVQPLGELLSAAPRAAGVALNDVVLNAGEPFRMIELEVQIDEQRTTSFRADGLVISTASGSTGDNLSAGGPLISPSLAAMVVSPICPHTLSFRPVVIPADSAILVCPHRLNPGSRVSFDGQMNVPITENECVLVRRAKTCFTLVENPKITHWQMLAQKMHWAQNPRQ